MNTEHSEHDRDTFEHGGIIWGAKIDASNDGKPLPWLKNDDMVFCYWGKATSGGPYDVDCVHGWDEGFQIRLPADHFAYTAIAEGFEPWGGGENPPADWDGDANAILYRDGKLIGRAPCSWVHFGSGPDIIGYKRKVDAAQYTVPASDIAPAPTPAEDIVRVLRVIEYVGPRSAIEKQILGSVHGEHTFGYITIKAATVGTFPEILEGSK